MKTINIPKLIASLLIPLLVGIISGFFTDLTWYSTINKPWFTPPNWLFMPVWTALYILIGLSFYLAWNTKNNNEKTMAYTYYFSQLSINFMWSFVFFTLHLIFFSVLVIVLLIFLIALTITEFYKIDKNATYLQIPYITWVCFAWILNLAVYLLN